MPRVHVTAVLMFGVLQATLSPAHAQTKDAPYPEMAPLAQYLITDRNAEIRLARSAAPPAISNDADVMVLGRQGYEAAVHGSNGFVCLVERSWTSSFDDPEFWNPRIRSPICFNPAAVRSVVPLTYKKTALALTGLSRSQMMDGLKDALRRNELPEVEVGAMCFMMSRDSYLGDSVGHGPAHLMFFVPNRADGAGWGENLPGSPIFRLPESASFPEPVRTYIIATSTWSDGKPTDSAKHSH